MQVLCSYIYELRIGVLHLHLFCRDKFYAMAPNTGEQECVIQAVGEQKHAQDEADVAAMDGGGYCPLP